MGVTRRGMVVMQITGSGSTAPNNSWTRSLYILDTGTGERMARVPKRRWKMNDTREGRKETNRVAAAPSILYNPLAYPSSVHTAKLPSSSRYEPSASVPYWQDPIGDDHILGSKVVLGWNQCFLVLLTIAAPFTLPYASVNTFLDIHHELPRHVGRYAIRFALHNLPLHQNLVQISRPSPVQSYSSILESASLLKMGKID